MDLLKFETVTEHWNRVMILSPHQDDEIFGCGGLLVKLAAECKTTIKLIYATDGAKGMLESGLSEKQVTDIRNKEAVRVLSSIGINQYVFLNFPDGKLNRRIKRFIEELDNEIGHFLPDVLIVPSPAESHHDHRAVIKAAMHVNRIHKLPMVCYEVWNKIQTPNFYLRLSAKEYGALLALGELYKSQRALISLLSGVRIRGKEIGVPFAEAYLVVNNE